ncbi:MAG: type II toxin-antitoxin system VapC family toxin [Terrimicrobiaceae bacterium]
MRVLLDTCALFALSEGSLSAKALQVIEGADTVVVSIVSPWEIAIKLASGKLILKEPVLSWFDGMVGRYLLQVESLDAETACSAASLPPLHRDPFDRILVAMAQRHSLTIITSDSLIPTYPRIQTVW